MPGFVCLFVLFFIFSYCALMEAVEVIAKYAHVWRYVVPF